MGGTRLYSLKNKPVLNYVNKSDTGNNFSASITNGPMNSLNPYKSSHCPAYNRSGKKLPGNCGRALSNFYGGGTGKGRL